ncbi:MAG: hypothetical protein WC492_01050 [Candidatus Micrarchaeia archaeon]
MQTRKRFIGALTLLEKRKIIVEEINAKCPESELRDITRKSILEFTMSFPYMYKGEGARYNLNSLHGPEDFQKIYREEIGFATIIKYAVSYAYEEIDAKNANNNGRSARIDLIAVMNFLGDEIAILQANDSDKPPLFVLGQKMWTNYSVLDVANVLDEIHYGKTFYSEIEQISIEQALTIICKEYDKIAGENKIEGHGSKLENQSLELRNAELEEILKRRDEEKGSLLAQNDFLSRENRNLKIEIEKLELPYIIDRKRYGNGINGA